MSKELFQATPEELVEAALRGKLQPVKYYADSRDEELEALLARHRHEIAKLKLESDRRARRVAERMLALCKLEIKVSAFYTTHARTEVLAALDGINIEALVDESRL